MSRAAVSSDAGATSVVRVRPGSALPWAAIGAVCGLAWASSLRGFMSAVAGAESAVTWSGTFGWLLLPGVACGALLGWAEFMRRTGGRRYLRYLVLSPLLFASVLLMGLADPATLFQDGIGGGAIGVPVIGMIGGIAFSGRGRVWLRMLCGLVVLAGFTVWALTATSVGGPGFALSTAHASG